MYESIVKYSYGIGSFVTFESQPMVVHSPISLVFGHGFQKVRCQNMQKYMVHPLSTNIFRKII